MNGLKRVAPWVLWGLTAVLAAIAALKSGQPIVIPPPPVTETAPPPLTMPVQPPESKPDPLNALVRIQRSGVGCSATIIGPRRADGRYWVLSAAHCTSAMGERWTARFRDGRTTGLVVTSIDKQSDCCWMLTDVDSQVYPYALLADSTPAVGTRIWHAGYGVDVPGNREDGTVTGGADSNGQIRMRLSVSSGDSGGGIVVDADGRVVSCVCCTTQRGAVADVWGASPERIRRVQTVDVSAEEWTPIPLPMRAKE